MIQCTYEKVEVFMISLSWSISLGRLRQIFCVFNVMSMPHIHSLIYAGSSSHQIKIKKKINKSHTECASAFTLFKFVLLIFISFAFGSFFSIILCFICCQLNPFSPLVHCYFALCCGDDDRQEYRGRYLLKN